MTRIKSPATVGALWIIAATVIFTVMSILVRYVSDRIPALETVFFRSLVGIAILLPWLLRRGVTNLRTRRFPMVLLRVGLNFAGVTLYFYALGAMPIAEAVSLHFTLPLFGIVGAAVFLKEGVGPHRWIAALIGFIGILVILRPGLIDVNLVAILVLVSAAGYAMGDLVLKSLSRTEPPDLLVFYLSAIHAPLSLLMLPLFSEWVTPNAFELGIMILIGFCGVGAHMCLTRAFAAADASFLMLLEFLRMPLTAFAAYLLFDEVIDAFTLLGAVIIFSSAYYGTHRERATARR